MRVLVLTNMYPPHFYGGYERLCQGVVERWRQSGVEVLVLTSDVRVPGVPESAEPPDEVRRHLKLYWADHEILDPPLRVRLSNERNNQAALRRAIDQFRPDVVSAWAMGAMSLSLLTAAWDRKLAVVNVVCDEWPVYSPFVDAWMRPLKDRPLVARAVHLLTGLPTTLPALDEAGPTALISEYLRQVVRERSPWSFPDSHIIHAGIEGADFTFRPAPMWSWKLVVVSRIDPRKGLSTPIEALAQCPPEAVLRIVGRGDDRHLEELKELATTLGVGERIEWVENASRSELAAHYAWGDAFIFPSVWEEPFGLVPLEAMATGTPVAATAVGGAKEFLVDGDNALVYPAGDASALAAALQRMAVDPDLRQRLIRAGRATAERLDVEACTAALRQLHEAAASGSETRTP